MAVERKMKKKTPPGSGENSFFWREPAGGLKFFEAVGQARIPAGSEIFEKQAREKKKRRKKFPQKMCSQGETRNTGDSEVVENCAHCARM